MGWDHGINLTTANLQGGTIVPDIASPINCGVTIEYFSPTA
jgi:hypothetical protein